MDTEEKNTTKYPVHTLEKSLEIIEAMKEAPAGGIRIVDISKKLNIGKSTIHRILSTLAAYGYVEKCSEGRKYRLGWKLFEIGSLIPRQRNLNNIDMIILEELSDKCEATVNLGIRINDKVAIIAKVDPQKIPFKAGPYLGEQEPLHATALGKILISELDDDKIKSIFKSPELVKYTNNTIDSLRKLRDVLARVREQGYAVDQEELCEGISCIAMPIRNYEQNIVAALSVSGPSFRFNFNKIAEIKQDQQNACVEISRFFGAH
ncbi:MAG: IclR family transcriptional regulator [Bacillota bacterium]|nr:IclR family transcriptional regulator [Bacillota bacterium]